MGSVSTGPGSGQQQVCSNKHRLGMFGVVVLGALAWGPLPAAAQTQPGATTHELSLARNYVFAACTAQRYPNTALALEADAWAAALVEQGGLNADRYPILARWAREAPPPSSSRNGVAMHLQSCFDFVNQRAFLGHLRSKLRQKADPP